MEAKRILISVDSLHSGGAEMFAIRLANYLAKTNQVYFLEFDGLASSDKKLKKLISDKIKYFSPSETFIVRLIYFFNRLTNFRWYKKFGKLANLYRSFLIRKIIVKYHIDVVHSHAIFQNVVYSSLKENGLEFKFIMTSHGHFEYYMEEDSSDATYLLNILKDKVDCLVYLTNEHLNTVLLNGFEVAKTRRILNGYEPINESQTSFDNAIQKDVFRVMIHSRAIEEKGWLEAIEAVKILKDKGYSIELFLVGNGPLLEQLSKVKLPSFIQVLGFREEIISLIYQCHLGLLPSYFVGESLPNSIIEYLYCGKPVIASNIGAIKEMLDAGNGDLAGELINTIKGKPVEIIKLADLIEKFITNEDYYHNKVLKARLAFNKFSMKNCGEAYLALY